MESLSKFERLMILFKKWDDGYKRDIDRGRIHFYADGSGTLDKYLCRTVLEFQNIDEVIEYLERRVELPSSDDTEAE